MNKLKIYREIKKTARTIGVDSVCSLLNDVILKDERYVDLWYYTAYWFPLTYFGERLAKRKNRNR